MTNAVLADAGDIPPGYELLRNQRGFAEHVGAMYLRKPTDGHTLAFGFRVASHHLNQGGVAHGGMLVTFIDHALGALVHTAAGRKPCSTISLDCNFVSPGKLGDWIECTAEIGRVTSSLVFVEGKLMAGSRTVLQAKGIWKVLDRWLGEKG
jgi:acyl-coenzyme A thioesterase PaaI-like protein